MNEALLNVQVYLAYLFTFKGRYMTATLRDLVGVNHQYDASHMRIGNDYNQYTTKQPVI